MDLSVLKQLNYKKIMLIILFGVLCIGLAVGIYWLFFRPLFVGPEDEVKYEGPGAYLPGVGLVDEVPGEGLPEIEEVTPEEVIGVPTEVAAGGDTLVLPMHEDVVAHVTLSGSGQGVNFYNPIDNKFYTLPENGTAPIALSNQEFYEVEKVYWNNDKTQAIITYPDKSKILYDFNLDAQATMDKSVVDPDFSNSDAIAFKYISTESAENNWLAVISPDGSQMQLVEHLGSNYDDVQVAWSPNNSVVALYAEIIGIDRTEIFLLGLAGENFKSFVVDGTHFKGMWSPSGTRMLYSVVSAANAYNPSLWIVDVEEDRIGSHKFSLGLFTWVERCTFADDLTVYCAVPRELARGAGLYPDELATETHDLIYKVDLTTGTRELIGNPVIGDINNFSITSVHISKDGQYLFFWDAITEKIYKMRLK